MSETTQPEALRLAAWLQEGAWHKMKLGDVEAAGRKLRRQHAELETLRAGYAAARLEIESLRARSAEPAGEYPPLPEPLEIDWPELHSHALGCGVEDRGLHNRYECAEYGWQDGVDKCAERVPDQIFDVDQMRAYVDADRAMRAAQPAGARVETAYGATEFGWTDWRNLQDGDKRLKALVVSLFGNDHQAFADLEALIDRASNGQAPAQVKSGCHLTNGMTLTDAIMHSEETAQSSNSHCAQEHAQLASWLKELLALREAGLLPTTQPAPQQEAPAAVAGPHVTDAMALAFHSALSDGALGSDEVEEIKVGLRAALAAAPTTQPAPQQEAQEPAFWTVCAQYEGGGETGWIPLPGYSNETEHGVKALVLQAARKEGYKGTATGRLMELSWEIRPVYLASWAAAQPSPASQGDVLDAARYRWLRNSTEWEPFDSAWLNKHDIYGCPTPAMDAAIDAARAAQEGK